jgi:hypothetical protein
VFSRRFPSCCALATVDSFRSLLEELVAPVVHPGSRIALLTVIQNNHVQRSTMDADFLRNMYLRGLGVPEGNVPTEAIDRLFLLTTPHQQDHINAINDLIANTNTTA